MSSGWITKRRRYAIYLRDKFKCSYCGIIHEPGEQLTLDHIVPRDSGGRNNNVNLITACKKCNSSKGKRSFADYVAYLDNMLIASEQEIRACVRRRRRRNMGKYLKMVPIT